MSAAGPGLPTPDDKRWAERASSLQFTQLSDMRATAERWRNALAGLTGLLGVTSLIVGPGLADKLSPAWRLSVGVCVGAGVIALLLGLYKAMSAAFGVPGESIRATGQRLQAWEAQQTKDASRALAIARNSSLIGITLLFVAAGATYAGARLEDRPAVQITTRTTVYCGTLQPASDGHIRIAARDGTVHTVELSQLTSITPAANC